MISPDRLDTVEDLSDDYTLSCGNAMVRTFCQRHASYNGDACNGSASHRLTLQCSRDHVHTPVMVNEYAAKFASSLDDRSLRATHQHGNKLNLADAACSVRELCYLSGLKEAIFSV